MQGKDSFTGFQIVSEKVTYDVFIGGGTRIPVVTGKQVFKLVGVNQKQINPDNLIIEKKDNDLVISVKSEKNWTLVLEDFYLFLDESSNTFMLEGEASSWQLTSADVMPVLYPTLDSSLPARDGSTVLAGPQTDDEQAVDTVKNDQAEVSEDFDIVTSGLSLIGGLGLSAGLRNAYFNVKTDDASSDNSENLISTKPSVMLDGSVTLGPLLDDHGLSIRVLSKKGDLLGIAEITEFGTYQIEIESGHEQVMLVVDDSSYEPDYIDEATGNPTNLNAQLLSWAVLDTAEDRQSVHVNPLTTIAARFALDEADRIQEVMTDNALNSINTSVASLFVESDRSITEYTVYPVIDQSGSAIDGNLGGQVLAVISALEAEGRQSTQVVVNKVLDGLSLDDGQLNVSAGVVDFFTKGAAFVGEADLDAQTQLIARLTEFNMQTNEAPTSQDDYLLVEEDGVLAFTEADFNFADANSADELVFITVTSLPEKGKLLLEGMMVEAGQRIEKAQVSKLTFEPAADEFGDNYSSIGFKVSDGVLESAEHSINVKVLAINDKPAGIDSLLLVNEDEAYTFAVTDFGFVDKDHEQPTSIMIVSLPAKGSLLFSGEPVALDQVIEASEISNLVYVPLTNENGAGYAQFDFIVNDGFAGSEDAATLYLSVQAVNDTPIAQDGIISVNEDGEHAFSVDDFGFADLEGDALASIRIVGLPEAGMLTLSDTPVLEGQVIAAAEIPQLKFAPQSDDYGQSYAKIRFHVNDGASDSIAMATLQVDVVPMNDAPKALNSTVAVNEDEAYFFSAEDFLFEDADGDALSHIIIDSLPSQGELKFQDVDVVAGQEIPIIGLGALSYMAAEDQHGDNYARFNYRVSDGFEISELSAELQLNVAATNDMPEGQGELIGGTQEETPMVILTSKLLTLATDIDGDSLTITHVSVAPEFGTVTQFGEDWMFTPAENVTSNMLPVTVTVSDGQLHNDFDVSVVVNNVNDAPEATGSTITLHEDEPHSFTEVDFGFMDIDGDALASITIVSLPVSGILELSGSPVTLNQTINAADLVNLVYTPDANVSGGDYARIGFTVSDGQAMSSSPADIQVDVVAVNDAPTAAGSTFVLNEDEMHTFSIADFGFSDVEGDSFVSVSIESLPALGTLMLAGTPVVLNQVIIAEDLSNLTYTPVSNQHGLDYARLGYRVNDGMDDSVAVAQLQWDVTAVNDAPTAVASAINVNEDGSHTFAASDFGYSDADDDALASITIEALPQAGTLELSNQAVTLGQVIAVSDMPNLIFTPAPDANGDDYAQLSFRVNDGSEDSAEMAQLQINVTSVNDEPTLAGSVKSLNEDETHTFSASDFGFADVDGDLLSSITVVSLPGAGSLQLSGAAVTVSQVIEAADFANLTFTPAANESGIDYARLEYRVNDGVADSIATAEIQWDVVAVNDAPIASGSVVTLNEDGSHTFSAADLGYSDVEGSNLVSVTIDSLPAFGALTLSNVAVTLNQVIVAADIPNLVFTPDADGEGDDYARIGFSVNDGELDSDTVAEIQLNVSSINDAPTAAGNVMTLNEDQVHTFSVADFGFMDVDGDAIASIRIESLPALGSLQLSGVDVVLNQDIVAADLPNLTYTPAANESGVDYARLGYRVNDGVIDSASIAEIQWDVTSENDAPMATGSIVTLNEDDSHTFTVADFGYSDVEGDSLTSITLESLPDAGTLTLSSVAVTLGQEIQAADIANLVFTPEAHAHGDDYARLGFRVNDGSLDSDVADIQLNVTSVNDAPVGVEQSVGATLEEISMTILNSGLLALVSDVENDALTITNVTTAAENGNVTQQADSWLYQPTANLTGANIPLTVTVSDGVDQTDFQIFVAVHNLNDAPVASGWSVALDENSTYTFEVADFAFSDVDGDALSSITITSLPALGSLQLSSTDVVQGQVIDAADIANLTYTPEADATGTDYARLSYTVNDGVEDSVASADLQIDVNEVLSGKPFEFVLESGDSQLHLLEPQALAGKQFAILDNDGDGQLTENDQLSEEAFTALMPEGAHLTFGDTSLELASVADLNGLGYWTTGPQDNAFWAQDSAGATLLLSSDHAEQGYVVYQVLG